MPAREAVVAFQAFGDAASGRSQTVTRTEVTAVTRRARSEETATPRPSDTLRGQAAPTALACSESLSHSNKNYIKKNFFVKS